MVLCIDVHYNNDTREAHAVGVLAESILSSEECDYVSAHISGVGDYVSGSFFKRELKCVSAVLDLVDLSKINLILVDGYADFGTEQRSLGTYVNSLYNIPVIGVAKNPYRGCNIRHTEIIRGSSSKPLYITSKGIDLSTARRLVVQMYGDHRLPYLIKLADTLSRDWSK